MRNVSGFGVIRNRIFLSRHRIPDSALVLERDRCSVRLNEPAPAAAQPSPNYDHYKVYRVDPIEVVPHPLVRLIDQFGTMDHEILQLEKFMNPTVKEHAGQTFPITDPFLHYSWWRVNDGPFGASVAVSNQFGDQFLQVGPAQYLLNPAIKNQTGSPPVQNHYQCYQCQGQAVNIPIVLTDQFDSWITVATNPAYFCTPVWKGLPDNTNYPIIEPDRYYTCYNVSDLDLQTFTAFFTDQFVTDANIVLTPGEMICVPSDKVVATELERRTWGRLKSLYR